LGLPLRRQPVPHESVLAHAARKPSRHPFAQPLSPAIALSGPSLSNSRIPKVGCPMSGFSDMGLIYERRSTVSALTATCRTPTKFRSTQFPKML
jgi:hypothetical protein